MTVGAIDFEAMGDDESEQRVIGRLIADRKRETAVRQGMSPKSPRQSRFALRRRRPWRLLDYAHAGNGLMRAVKEPIVTCNGHTSPEERRGGSC